MGMTDGLSTKMLEYSEKIDIGMVAAVIFSQLGIHEHERHKTRRRKARACG